MPNNILPISNEAVSSDPAIKEDPREDTSLVIPLNSVPEVPVPSVVEQDTLFEVRPQAKETIAFPEAPFQDLDEDEEKEEILLKQFASKMSAATVPAPPLPKKETIPMDTLLTDPDALDTIIQDSKENASIGSGKKGSDSIAGPKRKITMQNRTGKVFVEDELDILAQIEQVEAREDNPFAGLHDDEENDFARDFDKLVQNANQHSRVPGSSNAENDR